MMRALPTGLLALAGVLGVVILYQAAAPVAPVAAPPAAARPLLRDAELPDAVPPVQSFADINARMAFDPARQPAEEPRVAGPASAAPPDIALVGVAVGARASVALLKRAGAPAISVHAGQTVDGWQVAQIGPDFVVFRSGASDFTVRIRGAAGLPQPHLASPDTADGSNR